MGSASSLGGGVVFSDYLMHHFVQFIGLGGFSHWGLGDKFTLKHNISFVNLNYVNKTYRLNWELGYNFLKYYDLYSAGHLSLKYPLLKEGRWFSYISSTHSIERIEVSRTREVFLGHALLIPTPIKKSIFYHSRGSFYTGYSQNFPFNYFQLNKNAELQFFLDHKYKQNSNLWKGLKGGIIGSTMLHIGRDFYWTSSASYAVSLNAKANPVTVNAYSRTYPKEFDFHKKDNTPMNSNIVTDDTKNRSFVLGDISRLLQQNLYSAKSIGTAGIGLKKMFSLSSSNLFTLSVHSRYLIFEKLFHIGVPSPAFPEGDLVKASAPIIEAIVNISHAMDSGEAKDFQSQYTHWLEWTFGLEYIQILNIDLGGIVVGGSFGFRTPLKFWKAWQDDEPGGELSIPDKMPTHTNPTPETPSIKITNKKSNPVSVESIGSSLSFIDPSFQFYIKVPF